MAFGNLPRKKVFTKRCVKAGAVVTWLKEDFTPEHGHTMAVYALLKGAKKENPITTRPALDAGLVVMGF